VKPPTGGGEGRYRNSLFWGIFAVSRMQSGSRAGSKQSAHGEPPRDWIKKLSQIKNSAIIFRLPS